MMYNNKKDDVKEGEMKFSDILFLIMLSEL